MKCHALLMIVACASLGADAPSDTAIQKEVKRLAIPDSLMPKGKQPLLMVRAEGFQIYEADGKLQWAPQGPQATLRDYRTGDEVGTHSQGPIWVDAKGSKLSAQGKETAPAPNAEAIPWLLVQVKNENGGRFANVTHIQRVDTWAGMKPEAAPKKAGDIAKVPYEATYIFWGDRP